MTMMTKLMMSNDLPGCLLLPGRLESRCVMTCLAAGYCLAGWKAFEGMMTMMADEPGWLPGRQVMHLFCSCLHHHPPPPPPRVSGAGLGPQRPPLAG